MSVIRVRRYLAAALVGLSLAGCRRQTPPNGIVLEALLCEECRERQADSVAALGNQSIPMLVNAATLSSTDALVNAKRVAIAEWHGARRGMRSRITPADSQQSVNRSVERFITSYQRRAVYLLRRIGTPDAKQALGDIVRRTPRRPSAGLRPSARQLADSLLRNFP